MEFSPVFDWVDVPDPGNPPPGARLISAEDLLRYENALVAAKGELELLGGAGQRGYVVKQQAGRTVSVWDYLNNREQLIYGDTGERNVTALTNSANATAGNITVSRSGNTVELSIYNLSIVTAGGSLVFGALPPGFRPASAKYYTLPSQIQGTSPNRSAALSAAGNLSIYNTATGDTFRETLVYKTNDPWPTALPGVAA